MKQLLLTKFLFLFFFTFNAAYGQYCTTSLYSTGCSADDRIDLFVFNTINNPTSNCPPGGYSDFTNLSTNVTIGQSYQVTVGAGPFGSQQFAVWIDLNNNQIFEASEFLWNTTTSVAANASTTGTITIPLTASPGPKRLRVRGNFSTVIIPGNACFQYTWGETEDYTVVINSLSPYDIGLTSLVSPGTFCGGLENVSVRLNNFGSVQITSATVNWTMNGIPQPPTVFTGLLDTSGGTGSNNAVVSLGQFNFLPNTNYNLVAWSSNPNGLPDTVFINDTISRTLRSSLAGTISIGTGAGFDFPNLVDAANALSQFGVCAPVTINVDSASGPYTGQISFNNIPGTSATNTITINGNGAVITSGTTTSNRAIIALNNADYMTFDRLRIVGTDPTGGFGFHLRGTSDFVTIKNCDINLSAVTSTSTLTSGGIVSSNSVTSTTDDGANARFLTIENNTIRGSASGGPYYGIYLNGAGTTGADATNCKIINNTIRDFYAQGVVIDKGDSALIVGNDISKPFNNQTTFTTTFYGVWVFGTVVAGTTIERNAIHNPYGGFSGSTSLAAGIFINQDAPIAAPTRVINNVIYNMNGIGTTYGIQNSGSDNCQIYFNTINLNVVPSTGVTRGFFQTTVAAGVDFGNNIVNVTRGGSGAAHCIFLGTNTSTVFSNRNLLNAANGASVGTFGTTNFSTLANWQTANNNAYDQNSAFGDPSFISSTGPLLIPNAGVANNIASPVTGVTTDFAGVTRDPVNPDPGAFEFTPAANDAGAIEILPVSFCPGLTNLSVRVRNYGTAALTSVQATLVVNGTVAGTGFFSGSLPTGSDTLIPVGSFTFMTGTVYNLVAYTSIPNGSVDPTTINDTVSRNGLTTALSGIVTVGGGSANYPTLGALASAVTSAGVCGPLEVNITGNTSETGAVIFPTVGSGFPITIRPVGGSYTITGNVSGALLRFNGTDSVTINGDIGGVRSLTISNTSTALNSAAIFLSSPSSVNGCFNFKLRNCIVEAGSSSVTSTFGLIAAGTTIGTFVNGSNHDFLTIENNIIRRAYYGLYIRGLSTDLYDSLLVSRNLIGDSVLSSSVLFRGIDVQNAPFARITDNRIFNMELSTSASIAAIEVGGGITSSGMRIERNIIRGVRQLSTGGWGAWGINLIGGNDHVIANNMISGVFTLNYQTTSNTFNGFGIRLTSGTGHRVYYNSVNITGNYSNTSSGGAAAAAFCVTSTAVNSIDVRNNIFAIKTTSINNSGAVNFMAVWFPTGYSFATNNLNNNGYFVPNGSAQHFVGKIGTTANSGNFIDLNAWRAVSQVGNATNDVNSQPANNGLAPFANDDSLFIPAGTFTPIESGASPVAFLGTPNLDINNVARPAGTGTAPDIGAAEFEGQVGDFFGPDIDTVFFSPGAQAQCVASSRLVTAVVTDPSNVDTVQIIYTVNSGAPVVVSMNLSGFNTYQGVIPAQGSGKVSFRVRAVDDAPAANFSLSNSFNYQDEILGDGLNASTTTPVINVGDSARISVFSPLLGQLKITEFILFRGGTGTQSTFPTYVPTTAQDFVEITNLSTGPVSIGGFQFDVYGTGARPTYTFPAGATIPASGVLLLHVGTGTDDPANNYYNTGGTTDGMSSGTANGFVLRSSAGAVIDAVAVNAYIFTPANGVSSSDWTGAGVNSPSGVAGASLIGADQNTNANWVPATTNASSLPTVNPGLVTSNPLSVTWFYNGVSIGITPSLTTNPILIPGVNTFIVVVSDSICTTSDTVTVNAILPTAPVVNFGASTTVTSTGQTVTFTDSSTNLPSSWTWVFSPATVTYVNSTSANSQNPQVQFNLPGVYTVTLTAGNGAGSSSLTKTNYITVTISYCSIGVNSPIDTDIGNVTLSNLNNGVGTPTLNNSSATGQYTDFTALPPAVLIRDSTYTMSMTHITSGGIFYAAHFNVFIDYNQNGLFTEPGERVINGPTVQAAPTVSGPITIPSTATLGLTRMRVILDEAGSATSSPCTSFFYGEVEDYTVNIVVASGSVDEKLGSTLSVYPNPANKEVLITLPFEIPSDVNIQLTDLAGKTVMINSAVKAEANTILMPIDQLADGMYMLRVFARDQVFSTKLIKK